MNIPNWDYKRSLVIEVAKDFQDRVMLEAGYFRHWKGNGWVKYSNSSISKKRFHVTFFDDMHVQLHVDRTVNNKHKVFKEPEMLRHENNIIKKIWKRHNPILIEKKRVEAENIKIKKERKLKRNVFAPNLLELQRNFKGNIL